MIDINSVEFLVIHVGGGEYDTDHFYSYKKIYRYTNSKITVDPFLLCVIIVLNSV